MYMTVPEKNTALSNAIFFWKKDRLSLLILTMRIYRKPCANAKLLKSFQIATLLNELNRNFKESVYADGYMVVDIGALPNNSTKSVPANIPSAASEYWISNAWCKSRATGQVSPMPYIDVSTWSNAIGITISASKNIVVITKADWSAYSGKAVIAYKLSFI